MTMFELVIFTVITAINYSDYRVIASLFKLPKYQLSVLKVSFMAAAHL